MNDGLRSQTWFSRSHLYGVIGRGFFKASGFSDRDLERPIIGICNTWSEFNNCHGHFRELVDAIKRGVARAGGTPVEFPSFSIHENMTALNATPLMYRNLVSMETEELILAQPMDGVVLLGGCDKTIPAQLMAAASANLPAIILAGGPSVPGRVRNRRVGCWDISRAWQDVAAERVDAGYLDELEAGMNGSCGTCDVMGTASTMASLAEALGMSLPGSALIPAMDPRRRQMAEETGAQAVALVRANLRPSDILTEGAFTNAARVLMATAGSTNGIIHLMAVARRAGVPLPLDAFDRLSRTTPFVCNVAPSGEYWIEDVFDAGGVPSIMHTLRPLLDLDARTVTGQTVGDNLAGAGPGDPRIITGLDRPLAPDGGLAILFGNLAPTGAVIKQSAASPALLQHRGRALVFDSPAALGQAMLDDSLEVRADHVLVLRNQGPVGAPGMPHSGNLPLPRKLRREGVLDMVRLSDATMSGTAAGTIVLHVTPESAVGGPLALVQTGDEIVLDMSGRRLDVVLTDAELAERRRNWVPPQPAARRGYIWLYLQHVLQASEGCDFDFLGPDGVAAGQVSGPAPAVHALTPS